MGEVFNLSSNQKDKENYKITRIFANNSGNYGWNQFTPVFIKGKQYFAYKDNSFSDSSSSSCVGYLDYYNSDDNYTSGGEICLDSPSGNSSSYVLKDEYKNYFNINKNILKVGQEFSASGFTALNYLNPISAFASIPSSHIEYKNSIGYYDDYYNNYGNVDIVEKGMPLPYYLNAEVVGTYIIPNTSTNSGSRYFFIETSPADPGWALALTWMGLLALFGGLTSLGYTRKDFK